MATSKFHAFMGGDGVTTGEVHWGAVFAGVIVSLVGQLLLTLLGAGLGATTIDTANADTIAIGAFAWWAVTGIFCGFAGGWTAGWVAGSSPTVDRIEGPFQAFLSWACTALIVTAVIFTLAATSPLISRMAGPLSYSITHTVERAAEGSERAQDTVADVASKSTLASFFALLIGAIVAMGGGYMGVVEAKRMIASSPGATAATTGATAPPRRVPG
jgi:hypothetical protein